MTPTPGQDPWSPRETREDGVLVPVLRAGEEAGDPETLATTVAVHPFDKDEKGGKMPLIVTMPYGSGKKMFIAETCFVTSR